MYRAILRGVLAALMIAAGSAHLIAPQIFDSMMPPYLPYPRALILLSGVFEILGGLGMTLPAPIGLTRRTETASRFDPVVASPRRSSLPVIVVPVTFDPGAKTSSIWRMT